MCSQDTCEAVSATSPCLASNYAYSNWLVPFFFFARDWEWHFSLCSYATFSTGWERTYVFWRKCLESFFCFGTNDWFDQFNVITFNLGMARRIEFILIRLLLLNSLPCFGSETDVRFRYLKMTVQQWTVNRRPPTTNLNANSTTTPVIVCLGEVSAVFSGGW
jgi:hypothetical protein